ETIERERVCALPLPMGEAEEGPSPIFFFGIELGRRLESAIKVARLELAMRRVGQLRLLAAARDAIQPGADVDEGSLDGKEGVVERCLNRVERRRRRLITSLDFGLGFLRRFNLLDRSYAIIGAEYRYFSGVQPDVPRHGGTRVVWIRDRILEIRGSHGLHGLVGGHAGGQRRTVARCGAGGERKGQQQGRGARNETTCRHSRILPGSRKSRNIPFRSRQSRDFGNGGSRPPQAVRVRRLARCKTTRPPARPEAPRRAGAACGIRKGAQAIFFRGPSGGRQRARRNPVRASAR